MTRNRVQRVSAKLNSGMEEDKEEMLAENEKVEEIKKAHPVTLSQQNQKRREREMGGHWVQKTVRPVPLKRAKKGKPYYLQWVMANGTPHHGVSSSPRTSGERLSRHKNVESQGADGKKRGKEIKKRGKARYPLRKTFRTRATGLKRKPPR